MTVRFPIDQLQEAHHQHYRAGTWESFVNWFERSGHGDLLQQPWLRSGVSKKVDIPLEDLDLSKVRSICFDHTSSNIVNLQLRCRIEHGPVTISELFTRFVRSIGHTHLLGDFRHNTRFFGSIYTGPRFILFDGGGTCLLLGAMFQSMAERCCGEHIQLHYSHTANFELTHVFASWEDNFVDPDQKTFVPMEQLNQSALFGYLFQQLGVAAYQIFLAIPELRRRALFRQMTLDYFAFYDDSRMQYMYQSEQSVQVVSTLFTKAREEHCTDLDIYANDFQWKHQMLNEAAHQGIDRPYFLANQSAPVDITIPPQGKFEIGLLNPDLPEEAALLSALFLGRVPGALTFPGTPYAQKVSVPEVPWMIVFDRVVQIVTVNGEAHTPWMSTCGHFRLLGMGDLEYCIVQNASSSEYEIELGPCGGRISVVLPINALAIGAGQVEFLPASALGISAWVAV